MNHKLSPLFRSSQYQALEYKSGKMAVLAVPGSGKTYILSHLAAKLIRKLSANEIKAGKEILVVTFSNSAVQRLKNQLAKILGIPQDDRIPGCRIRTLHGLAHDILIESRSMANRDDDFIIVDEIAARRILHRCVADNLVAGSSILDDYISPLVRANRPKLAEAQRHLRSTAIPQLCERFIRHCKGHVLRTPEDFAPDEASEPILGFFLEVYMDYQSEMRKRDLVDYDDLVLLAVQALRQQNALIKRLQKQWNFILEDEAQDSSAAQEQMLALLSANKNWVRVGDPNQSINATFSSADPQYLRRFAAEQGVTHVELAEAGRSGHPIIDLANALVRWVSLANPLPQLRDAFDQRFIRTVSIGDPQTPPTTLETSVHIHFQRGKDISPQAELTALLHSLQRWLVNNQDKTVAILVPENRLGYRVIDRLQTSGIVYDELLRSGTEFRETADDLLSVLKYLDAPFDARLLAALYESIALPRIAAVLPSDEVRAAVRDLRKLQYLETYLYPFSDPEDLPTVFATRAEAVQQSLRDFRRLVCRWLEKTHLPVDQQIVAIGRDLYSDDARMDVVYQIASALQIYIRIQPQDAPADGILRELAAMSRNERYYMRQPLTEGVYDPRPGIVTVATIHGAKGQEWDRVYILGINSHAFPSLSANASFVAERWYIRNHLNLEAEILARLDAAISRNAYVEGSASQSARAAFVKERLRLLYVGITRAKQDLILMWNTGLDVHRPPAEPAEALIALHDYLAGRLII